MSALGEDPASSIEQGEAAGVTRDRVRVPQRTLPVGTVTFLFTDVEGSTRLLGRLGDRFAAVLEDHNRLLRDAFEGAGGTVVRTEGDAFFVAFPSAPDAFHGAVAAQRSVAGHGWPEDATVRVRMGIHTGEGVLGGDDYVGLDVHLAARIGAAGHGGQILLSGATRALVEEGLPDGVTLRDLGEHTLKDFDPQHLFQAMVEGLRSEFPPLRSATGARGNLPAQLTRFIGREAQAGEVETLLRDGTRMLTLTGPGGTGKTRLALHVATRIQEAFPHGAYFVDLSSITDPGLVLSAVAEAVGVVETPQEPLADTLIGELGDRRLLLVLDNFEHVLGAAPAVERLLREAPGITALVTSRAVLHREGEQEYPVLPLELPGPGRLDHATLARNAAVALFVDRATAVKPSFRLTEENAPAVVGICARLDGLPLAIELAASRSKLLTPQQILDRLEERLPLLTSRAADAPDRRKTLRGTIQWSYDLLDEQERRLFEHVSVFRGGGTLEAMEGVCSLAGGTDTFEGLASLVDNSLIRLVETEGESRFVMLETIREYALDRLTERGEREEVSRRHASYFLGLAERAEPNLTGPEVTVWNGRLTSEHDNIRGVLRWAIESDDAETGMRLAGAIWRFWHLRSHFAEARTWFDELLALPSARGRTAARVKGLTGLGGIAYWQGDYPAAERAYAEAVEIARHLGDRRRTAEALVNLSYMPALRGDITAARRLGEEAIALFEEGGDVEEADQLRADAGYYKLMEGDLPGARALLERNFTAAMASDDVLRKAMAHHVMGQLERLSGKSVEATAHYREAIRISLSAEADVGILEPLEALASVASMTGEHERGVRFLGAAQAIREELGGGPPPEWLLPADVLGEARRALGDEAVQRALAKGRAMTPRQAAEEALTD